MTLLSTSATLKGQSELATAQRITTEGGDVDPTNGFKCAELQQLSRDVETAAPCAWADRCSRPDQGQVSVDTYAESGRRPPRRRLTAR